MDTDRSPTAMGGAGENNPTSAQLADPILTGLFFWYATSSVVLGAAAFGTVFVPPSDARGHVFDAKAGAYANWDGQWYLQVASTGYSFRRDGYSSVNFFPAYPLMGRLVYHLTGVGMDEALVLVSNLSLIFAFVVLASYTSRRSGEPPAYRRWVLLGLGLAPTACFFRVAYSESLLLLLTALFLLGTQRRWPLIALAGTVGLATATRPVGVCLVPALIAHAWDTDRDIRRLLVKLCVLVPISVWGLLAYVAFQAFALNDPLAFVKSHDAWNRRPGATAADKAWALLTLEPVWIRFIPSSSEYWVRHDGQGWPLFSLYLADPFYFLLVSALVCFGTARRILNRCEAIIAIGFMAMPLVSKAFETSMEGFGRYAFGNLPAFFVAGHMLCRIPSWISIFIIVLCSIMMFIYTIMFFQWYPTI